MVKVSDVKEPILQVKESVAVQAHIDMLQGMITRMAANSANCKLWCITIVVAILGLFCENKFSHIELGFFVTTLFYFLDCYYLGIERSVIEEQKKYVFWLNQMKTHEVALQTYLPYSNRTAKTQVFPLKRMATNFVKVLGDTLKGMISLSTTPFYCAILFVIYYII